MERQPQKRLQTQSHSQQTSALLAPVGDSPLSVAGLCHWFGEGEARKQVLFDVDIALERGKLTILMRASGSGKTTLLTLMGCLRRVQKGSIALLGNELNGASEDMLVLSRR